jgi:hypothetical protein
VQYLGPEEAVRVKVGDVIMLDSWRGREAKCVRHPAYTDTCRGPHSVYACVYVFKSGTPGVSIAGARRQTGGRRWGYGRGRAREGLLDPEELHVRLWGGLRGGRR